MKKAIVALVLIILSVCEIQPVNAISTPDIVLRGFEKYVLNSKSELTTATEKFNMDTEVINARYSAAIQTASTTYDSEILMAKKRLDPQIENSIQILKNAEAKLLTVNQVKVLMQGNDRNKWGFLNCSVARPECKADDKGELFQIGEVTTLKTYPGDPSEFYYIRDVQKMVDDGLIELMNPGEYLKVTKVIQSEPDNTKYLNEQLQSLILITTKMRDNALNSAKLISDAELFQLTQSYESKQQAYKNQINAGNAAIRATKRAKKNPGYFEKAFVTAFKFEYNAQGFDDIANLPLSSLNSLRSILSQYTVIDLANEAAAVSAYYSYSGADKINKIAGKVFTVDKEFQISAKLVAEQFKKFTKIALKF